MLVSATLFNDMMEKIVRAEIDEIVKQQVKTIAQQQQLNETQIRELREELRQTYYHQYGLDKPKWYRILYNSWRILTFNLGRATSMTSSSGTHEVSDIIVEAIPNTVLLFTTGTVISLLIGLFCGLYAARNPGLFFDRFISIFAMVTYTLPMWWTGMLFIYLFAYKLGILPSGGIHSIPPPKEPFAYFTDLLWHLTLPLATLVFVSFGSFAYVVRNIVLGTFQQDFVIAARAKGMPERHVVYKHVLRAASPPIVTMMLFGLLGSLGGAIITEAVFDWPGMGRLYWIAVEMNDVPVLLGLTFVFTFIYLVATVVVDLIYGLLDPRVRIGLMAGGK